MPMFPAPLSLDALCLSIDSHHVLVFGEGAAGRYVSFGPPVYVRFAFAPVAGREYLIPAKVVDDWGRETLAPAAYDWIEARGSAFPRADVAGLTPGGQPRQCFMKELDLASAPLAFAARSPDEFPGLLLSCTLWLDATLSPDAAALVPAPAPHPLLARAVPGYSLHPASLGGKLAGIISEGTILRHTR